MANITQKPTVGQNSVLWRFDDPLYSDIGGLGRVFEAADNLKENFGNTSITQQLAGMLGPNSRSPSLKRISPVPIDVKQDFLWTASKSDPARSEMPYVYMVERIVDRSSRLQNLLYNTVSLTQSPLGVAAVGAAGYSVASRAVQRRGGSAVTQTIAGVAGAAAGAGAATAGTEFLSNLTSGSSFENNLRAYSGLYSTTDTGFKYKLPFVKLQGTHTKSISQNWGEASRGGDMAQSLKKLSSMLPGSGVNKIIGGVGIGLEAFQEGSSTAMEMLGNLFEGAYSESAKSFNYNTSTPSFEISFYLFNNINWSDTVKNWYLTFALQYQNLPNRLNRLILTPSVIYEVTVPGYFYSMYSYVSSISVDYIGTSILLDLPVFQTDKNDDAIKNISTNEASSVQKYIKVMVPEAYKITLNVQSLVPETQNLLYEAQFQTRLNNGTTQTPQPQQAPPPQGSVVIGGA